MKRWLGLSWILFGFAFVKVFADVYVHMDKQNLVEFNLKPDARVRVVFILEYPATQHSCFMNSAIFENFQDTGLGIKPRLSSDKKVITFVSPENDTDLHRHFSVDVVNTRKTAIGVILNCQSQFKRRAKVQEKEVLEGCQPDTVAKYDFRNGFHAQDLILVDLISEILDQYQDADQQQLDNWIDKLKSMSKQANIKPFWQPTIKWIIENIRLSQQKKQNDMGAASSNIDINLTLCQKKGKARKRRGSLMVEKRVEHKKKKRRSLVRKKKKEKMPLQDRLAALDLALQAPKITFEQLDDFERRAISLGDLVKRYKDSYEDVDSLTEALGDINLRIQLITQMLLREHGYSRSLLDLTMRWVAHVQAPKRSLREIAKEMDDEVLAIQKGLSGEHEDVERWIQRLQTEFQQYMK